MILSTEGPYPDNKEEGYSENNQRRSFVLEGLSAQSFLIFKTFFLEYSISITSNFLFASLTMDWRAGLVVSLWWDSQKHSFLSQDFRKVLVEHFEASSEYWKLERVSSRKISEEIYFAWKLEFLTERKMRVFLIGRASESQHFFGRYGRVLCSL